MATYKAKPITINKPAADIAARFADLTYLQDSLDSLPAEERAKVGDVRFTADTIVMNTAQVGEIKFEVKERTPERVAFVTAGLPLPMPMTIAVDMKPKAPMSPRWWPRLISTYLLCSVLWLVAQCRRQSISLRLLSPISTSEKPVSLLYRYMLGGSRNVVPSSGRRPRAAHARVAEFQHTGRMDALRHPCRHGRAHICQVGPCAADYPYTALDETGYGGVLLLSDVHGVPKAYDAACPVEVKRDVRVFINGSHEAECPCATVRSTCFLSTDILFQGVPPSRVGGCAALVWALVRAANIWWCVSADCHRKTADIR